MDKDEKWFVGFVIAAIAFTIIAIIAVYELLTILEKSRLGQKVQYYLSEPNEK